MSQTELTLIIFNMELTHLGLETSNYFAKLLCYIIFKQIVILIYKYNYNTLFYKSLKLKRYITLIVEAYEPN